MKREETIKETKINKGTCGGFRTASDTKARRHEPLNEAHESTFGILENYHCWRFHGSGVIASLKIIGLIFLCTGMHHEYFLGVADMLSCSHLCSKIPKIYNWSMDSGVLLRWFRH